MTSPFQDGEQAIQHRVGVRDAIEALSQRLIHQAGATLPILQPEQVSCGPPTRRRNRLNLPLRFGNAQPSPYLP